jgi:hypothetical protein
MNDLKERALRIATNLAGHLLDPLLANAWDDMEAASHLLIDLLPGDAQDAPLVDLPDVPGLWWQFGPGGNPPEWRLLRVEFWESPIPEEKLPHCFLPSGAYAGYAVPGTWCRCVPPPIPAR